jgi:hypothetical protein
MPSTTRSFRLDDELLQKISLLAKQHGLTENQLVSKWLSSRAALDSLISPLGGIGVGTETLEAILGTADIHALDLAGWELGEKHFLRARAALAGLGEDLTFQRYLEETLAESGWFRVTVNNLAKSEELILDHDLSSKWSIFLKSYVSGAHRVISKEKLVVDVSESFIRVKLSNG